MFVQTEITPNPNSLKFLPGKKVSNDIPIEIVDKNETNNDLIRNILSINGVTSIFLSDDFLSVNKDEKIEWEDLKHIIISFINDYYSNGNEIVIDKKNKISSNASLLIAYYLARSPRNNTQSSDVAVESNSDELEDEIPMDELLEEFKESLEEMQSEEIQTNYKSERVNKRNPVSDKQSILSRIFQGKTDRY